MFYLKLLELCKNRDVQVTSLLKKLSMSSGNLSKWKNGNIPKMNTVLKIAKYFNVSADYFFDTIETADNFKSMTLDYGGTIIYSSFDVENDIFIKDEDIEIDIGRCPNNHFYCKAIDDDMSKTGIIKDSIVLVKSGKDLFSGQIATVVGIGGKILFRRYNEKDGNITLTTEKINGEDEKLEGHYKIVGCAIEVRKIL